jgi:DMSO/TMAO reductase YedYZ molybdopterin-dependent catalytic subunit
MVDFDLRSLEGEALTLTPRDLEPLPKREMGAVLECAGDLVGAVAKVSNGLWQGWSLGDALGLAQPSREGYLNLLGRDGYARRVPLERAYGGGMLVTHLNRRPLDSKHGTP